MAEDLDIRIAASFFHNPKTILLRRRMGPDAILSLQQLWCYCRVNKPKGDLSGMSDDAIEVAAGWHGDAGKLIEQLTSPDTRFLDGTTGKYKVHNWSKRNPWAFGAPERSVKSRIAALEKHGRHADAEALRAACAPHARRMRVAKRSHAPSPSPSPLPIPSPIPVETTAGFDADNINSDSPLPPILQHEWDTLLDTLYPEPRGIVKGRDRAIKLFAKSAERARILRSAVVLAATDEWQRGYRMALDRFVGGAFRDYDPRDGIKPSGAGPPGGYDTSIQDEMRREREKFSEWVKTTGGAHARPEFARADAKAD